MATGDKKESVRNLVLKLDPSDEVRTSLGGVFLYEAGAPDIAEFSKNPPGESATQRVRWLLAKVASKEKTSDWRNRPPPLGNDIAQLSDEEIERLAVEYLKSPNNAYYAKKAAEAEKPVTREESESAVSFLDRLIGCEAGREKAEIRKLLDKFAGNSAKDIIESFEPSARAFVDLQRQSGALGNLINQFNAHRLDADVAARSLAGIEDIGRISMLDAWKREAPERLEFEAPALDHFRKDAEQRKRERDEELALTRQSGELSAQSAKLLTNLSDAATTFLAQFADNNRKSEMATRKSLRIAMWSLIGTVLFTAFALIVAIAAYRQDTTNNSSNDEWQRKALEIWNRQDAVSEKVVKELSAENIELRVRLEVLEAKAKAVENSRSRVPRKSP